MFPITLVLWSLSTIGTYTTTTSTSTTTKTGSTITINFTTPIYIFVRNAGIIVLVEIIVISNDERVCSYMEIKV